MTVHPARRRPILPRALVAATVALCLALAGLAPSISRALAAPAPIGLHDLCVADPAGAGPADPHDGHEPACALCVAHGATHAAPPPAVVAVAAKPADAPVPAGPARAPSARPDRNPPAARAPPDPVAIG